MHTIGGEGHLTVRKDDVEDCDLWPRQLRFRSVDNEVRQACCLDQFQTPAFDGTVFNSGQDQIIHVTAKPYVIRPCEHFHSVSEGAAIERERGQGRRLDKAIWQTEVTRRLLNSALPSNFPSLLPVGPDTT